MQIRAEVIKDSKGLFRTSRIFIILAVFLFLTFSQPILFYFLPLVFELSNVPAEYLNMIPEVNLQLITSGIYADLTDMGVLGFLLSIMTFIGGESKKRSLIIPFTKGFKMSSYINAKFLLFPCLGFIITFVFSLLGYFGSLILFYESVDILYGFTSAFLVGLEVMFITVVCTFIGLVWSRPGIGIGIVYVGRTLIMGVFSIFNWNRFYPFALHLYASLFRDTPLLETWISVGITIVLMIGFWGLTHYLLQRRNLRIS